MLRAVEVHLLFHRIATEATAVIAAAIAGRKSHDNAWTSAQKIVGMLRLYAEHFPEGRDSDALNAIIDVAESMALRKIPMTMQDWKTRLNRFLDATDHAVLSDAGKVTTEIARAHTERSSRSPSAL